MKKYLPKSVFWNVITLYIGYTKKWLLIENVSIKEKCAYWSKMCLLNENVSTKCCLFEDHNPSYYIYQKVLIDQKDVYWLKMCLLKEKLLIEWKCVYWPKRCMLKMKSHNCLIFLNVYVALIYVAMWCNKERLTKSQKVPIGWKCAYWKKMYLLIEIRKITNRINIFTLLF